MNKILLTLKTIKNPLTFILDYLRITPKNKLIIYKTSIGSIYARAGTTDAGEIVIIFGDLEYPKKYFPTCKNPIILDIGANIGAFTRYVDLTLAQNEPLIYAFEPSKDNFSMLNVNTRTINLPFLDFLFGLTNFPYITKRAITPETKTYYLSKSNNFDSFTVSNIKTKNSEECEGISLEDFFKQNEIKHIDLMKMDIEGSEHEVFKKSIKIIQEKVKRIFVEVHEDNENNMKTFEESVTSNGFRIIDKIMNRTLVLDNERFEE